MPGSQAQDEDIRLARRQHAHRSRGTSSPELCVQRLCLWAQNLAETRHSDPVGVAQQMLLPPGAVPRPDENCFQGRKNPEGYKPVRATPTPNRIREYLLK